MQSSLKRSIKSPANFLVITPTEREDMQNAMTPIFNYSQACTNQQKIANDGKLFTNCHHIRKSVPRRGRGWTEYSPCPCRACAFYLQRRTVSRTWKNRMFCPTFRVLPLKGWQQLRVTSLLVCWLLPVYWKQTTRGTSTSWRESSTYQGRFGFLTLPHPTTRRQRQEREKRNQVDYFIDTGLTTPVNHKGLVGRDISCFVPAWVSNRWR